MELKGWTLDTLFSYLSDATADIPMRYKESISESIICKLIDNENISVKIIKDVIKKYNLNIDLFCITCNKTIEITENIKYLNCDECRATPSQCL